MIRFCKIDILIGADKWNCSPYFNFALRGIRIWMMTMFTQEENDFLQYWEQNRLRKRKVLKQLYVGFPFAVLLIIAIFANFFSGWYKRADMQIRAEAASLIPVLIGGALMIVAFIVIFSARHRWDMNEQRFNELLSRKKKE
ncbi:MAG TPA: hypothetical protein VN451_04845 [Chitinophagaceae bacterium]|nr:hypothetical protein [Chitinophagaceae bacterium]